MAEKNYQITQLQSDNSLLILHPETTAENVIYTNYDNTKTNVQTKVDDIVSDINTFKSGAVTGVKGSSETNYRTGNVNITKANIGLGNVNNVAITSEQVAQIGTNKTNITTAQSTADTAKSNAATAQSTANEAKTAASNAQTKANSAYALAEGRAKAVSFDTEALMTSSLKSASNTEYKVGDNLFIKATGVPDYWISKVLTTNTGTYGYYEVSILETQKVDLTSYQTKSITAISVNSVSKDTVEDALSGINSYVNTIKTSLDTTNGNITKIINGTTKVTNATNADNATEATHATSADNATSADSATTSTTCTGNAATATKLKTARTISLSGDASGSTSFDGSANKSIEVSLANCGTAGTYSVVTTDAKGRVTNGGQIIEIGNTNQTTPSTSLAQGGIFFKEI